MKKIDCLLYYNEIDVVEYRIRLLSEYVDYFVVLEGTETFTGLPRDLEFHKLLDRISDLGEEVLSKIKYYPIDYKEKTAWKREEEIRNLQLEISSKLIKDSLIFISDADEIANPNSFIGLSTEVERPAIDLGSYRAAPILKTFYGSLKFIQFKSNKVYPLTAPYFVHSSIKRTAQDLRAEALRLSQYVPTDENEQRGYLKGMRLVRNGGWHLSYFGRGKSSDEKMSGFSHQEAQIQQAVSRLDLSLEYGVDPFGREFTYHLPLFKELPPPVKGSGKLLENLGFPERSLEYTQSCYLERLFLSKVSV
jgi:beta-1,4-mannosyl-glycoprotein beta-1,4-N-acetylglucosaminyltransferase